MNHSKRFYKFMGLSYPGLKHAGYGLQERLISRREYAMIKKAIEERQPPPWEHAARRRRRHPRQDLNRAGPDHLSEGMNWTEGCIALDNADVDEIFSVVSLGTPVTILP